MRSAASKGPFDVVGLGSNGSYFVQVKRTKVEARKKFPRVVEELHALKMPKNNFKQIWVWVDKKGWYFIHIHEDGTTDEWWDDGETSYQKHGPVEPIYTNHPELILEANMLFQEHPQKELTKPEEKNTVE
jgi:hypothetical protein